MKKIMGIWSPVEVQETDNTITVKVTDREYVFDKNGMSFSSIKSMGQELLAGEVKITGVDCGEPIEFKEVETYLFKQDEKEVIILTAGTTKSMCFNLATTIEYDGMALIDLKVMARGAAFEEVFELYGPDGKPKLPTYELTELKVEIPFKPQATKYLHYSGSEIYDVEGNKIANGGFNSGAFTQSVKMPFKSILWFGNEDLGINWFCESAKNWQYDDKCALEYLKNDDENLLVMHLLNSFPKFWDQEKFAGDRRWFLRPITYQFGLMATPVRPFPKKAYNHKILHLDCFKKVKGDYLPFLQNPVVEGDSEIGFDRLKRLGVDTLVLHEKWNTVQNYWEMSPKTKKDVQTIVEECHKRGIGVVPYFGYEIASINPLYSKYGEKVLALDTQERSTGGWYRTPRQRDYIVCYNSEWGDMFAEGLCKCIEEMDFDGVYFDGTIRPWSCANEKHGCGYRDAEGNLHATSPILAQRRMMRKIFEFVHKRGGLSTTHLSSCMNNMAAAYTHLIWNGEDIQMSIKRNGISCVPEDYIRAEYLGRNTGIPNELLAYEFEGIWSFKDSLCFALPNGLLPRPNDIGKPLEICSEIWKIFEDFGLEDAEWKAYYNKTDITCDDDSVKISCYDKKDKALYFVANPNEQEKVIDLKGVNGKMQLLFGGKSLDGNTITLTKYDSAIILLKK